MNNSIIKYSTENSKENVISCFNNIYKKLPEHTAFTPYRICPIGAHSDHQLGKITGFAIDELNINEDVMVIAGDNVLDFNLTKFINYINVKKTSCVMRYFEPSKEKLVKCGVLKIDDNEKIINMTEKPSEPASNWCCPPFYYYSAEDTKRVKKGIADGCNTDAPGSYIAWLCKMTDVYEMEMPGSRYDIGNLQSFEKIQKEYKGISKC